jgi:TetR/AcrR family transcriptional regulator, transcriptional repressor of aconitase
MPRVTAAYLAERRAHVLAAATRCFAREGFHRATMQDVVRESGLSPGALYRYFASKEELVAAIAEERHAAERAALEAARDADVADAVGAIAHAFLGPLARREERAWRRVTVQLWSEALRSPAVMRVIRGGLDGPLRALAALFRRAQREGRLPDDVEPAALARVAAAVFQGLVLQVAWQPALDLEPCVAAALRLLDGLSTSPRARARGRARRTPRAPRPSTRG